MKRDEIIAHLHRAATDSAWWNPAALRAAAEALTLPAADWIECPETPPEPGWWWFRESPGSPPRPCETWGHASHGGARITGVTGTYTWPQWRADHPHWQMRTTPISEPGIEKSVAPSLEPLPRSVEQELRAWATEAERHHTDVGDPWRRGYLRSVSDMLLILDAAGEPVPPDPPPWRCAVCGRPGDDAEDGRCPCGSEEWVDAEGDEPDPEDVAEADADAEIKQRLDALESAKIAHGDQIALLWEQRNKLRADVDGHDDRFETLQGSTVDAIARVRGVLSDRMDDHASRLEVLETRLARAEALLEGPRR